METYVIKKDGVEIAKITGDNLKFGQKYEFGLSLPGKMVDDTSLLKMADPENIEKALFILSIRSGKKLAIEKVE